MGVPREVVELYDLKSIAVDGARLERQENGHWTLVFEINEPPEYAIGDGRTVMIQQREVRIRGWQRGRKGAK